MQPDWVRNPSSINPDRVESPAPGAAPRRVRSEPAPRPERSRRTSRAVPREIGFYFAVLVLLTGLGGGIAGIPIQFYLKEQLKLGPVQMSIFGALVGIPSYLGFVLGFLRDRWRPFGMGDRGYFALIAPLSAGCYLWLAAGPLTYQRLLLAGIVNAALGVLLGAAVQGLMASVGQREAMTGRLSALFGFVNVLPAIFTSLAGGWLTHHVATRATFLAASLLTAAVALLAFWKPRAIFTAGSEAGAMAMPEQTLRAVARLLRHRPLYPAAGILLLWNFCPGWGTPLFFYLTNRVKLSAQAYGVFQAVIGASMLVSLLFYGVLCRRFRLKSLLWCGTLFGILAAPLFLLIHNPLQSFAVAALLGALLGMTDSAFLDLFMRASPKALEGAAMMGAGALMAVAGATSDLFGSWLYQKGGFGLALLISLLFTALILPLLVAAPHALVATRDGERAVAPRAPVPGEARLVPEAA